MMAVALTKPAIVVVYDRVGPHSTAILKGIPIRKVIDGEGHERSSGRG
jgi:hypothetical protein